MKTIYDLEKYALKWGWNKCGSFWDWVTLRLVGYDRWELELEAEKAKAGEFTRWWYGSRMETMDQWMRDNAPEDVKEAYFSIVANGAATFSPKHLECKAASGVIYSELLRAADEAISELQDLRSELARLKSR